MLDDTKPPHTNESPLKSPLAILIDPVFFPPPQRFRYVIAADGVDLGAWLAQQITLHPRQLQLHVQRIVLHAEQGSTTQLGGAMTDLFIALGHAGFALRQRLLNATQSRLPTKLTTFLQAHLRQPLTATTPLPLALPWARLSLGISGVSELIHRERQTSQAHKPLELAQALLEEGNIDEATTLLEQSLQQSPNDQALQLELLGVCRATRDSGPLRRLQDALRMDANTRQQWEHTLTWLEEQEIRI